ncbi:hypothetical protein PLESTB_000639300 [Pleodorina starrii]|uniref:Uncharacterized protein n=1 Tax=Pleodorina starrii TaxID=330485 RepID=A0A9W6BIS0_9CHLO|nr:hypothetical protein PLESTB_000639300 [Pleodorina starrii]
MEREMQMGGWKGLQGSGVCEGAVWMDLVALVLRRCGRVGAVVALVQTGRTTGEVRSAKGGWRSRWHWKPGGAGAQQAFVGSQHGTLALLCSARSMCAAGCDVSAGSPSELWA